jgi:hypothetical protein
MKEACIKEAGSQGQCFGEQYLDAEKRLYERMNPPSAWMDWIAYIPVSITRNWIAYALVLSIIFTWFISTLWFDSLRALAPSLYTLTGVPVFTRTFPRHFVWELYALLATWLIGRLFVEDLRKASIRIAQSAQHDIKKDSKILADRLRDLLSAKDSSSIASTLYVLIAMSVLILHYYLLDLSKSGQDVQYYIVTSMLCYVGYIFCYHAIFVKFGKADDTTVRASPDYYNAISFWCFFVFSDQPAIFVLRVALVAFLSTCLLNAFGIIDINILLKIKSVIGGIIWMQVIFSNVLTGLVSREVDKFLYAVFLRTVTRYSRHCE